MFRHAAPTVRAVTELPAPSPAPSEGPAADGGVTAIEPTVAGNGAGPQPRSGGVAPAPVWAQDHRRVGQLTVAWQIIGAVAWAAAFFALAGVWKASEEIGIATWWLGPRADPQPIVVRIIPFAICVAMALCAIYNVRRFPWISLAGSASIAVIAVFDIQNSGGLALAEFTIAGALALVSLASFGGRYVAGAAPEGPGDGTAGPEMAAPYAADHDPAG